jgi:N-acetylglutamate synthase-like GNAT family acetyltransferase
MHDPASAAPTAATPLPDLPPPPPAPAQAGDIAIHRFLPGQAAAVRDLVLAIQQQEFGLPVTAAAQPDLLDIPAHYQRGHGDFWVALQAAQVVGCVGLLDIGGRRGALRKMFVAAPFRGGRFGVAQGLLQTLLRSCRDRGVDEVWLGTTEKFQAAHRFYEKHGFTRVDRDGLPRAFPVMEVDTRFYRWPAGARPSSSAAC